MISKHPRTVRPFLDAGVVLALAAGAATAAPPVLSLEDSAVIVAGLDPGATVVYFSVSRDSTGFAPRTSHRTEILVDEDGDGIIAVDYPSPPPVKFLAAAVEVPGGRFGVLTPPDSPAREVPAPGCLAEPEGCDEIVGNGTYVEMLLVRPDLGGWWRATADGGPVDLSGPGDGLVRIPAAALLPVGESPDPPDALEPGDVVVQVAPRRMSYYAVRIGG